MKTKRLFSSILSTLLIGAALNTALSTALPVQAQTTKPIDLAVSPPTTYLHIKPGTSTSHRLTIEQKGTVDVTIQPSLVDFTSDGKTGQPVLDTKTTFPYAKISVPASVADSVGADTKVENAAQENAFLLKANSKKNLSVVFTIPDNAKQGEFPMSLLMRAQQAERASLSTTNSEVSAIVASNIIVVISNSDKDKSKLTIDSIQAPLFIDSFMPLHFSVLASNDGDNASTASGSALLSDWQNQQIAEFPVYPDMILAKTTRQLRTTPSLSAAQTDPSLIQNTFHYRSFFLIGPYTLKAKLNTTTAQPTAQSNSQAEKTIIAFPFSIFGIGLLALLLWRFFLPLLSHIKSDSIE